ncbi:MAG: hypothetical protein ABI882_14880 [Acidobacteriota bacterium]
MFKKLVIRSLVTVVLVATGILGFAQNRQSGSTVTPANVNSAAAAELIRKFTTKESELRDIWKDYSYIQESKIQRIGPADTISGEFYQLSEFVFTDAGKRIQRILKAPPSILEQEGVLTAEDKNALTNLQPFALAADELPNYNVTYVGKEKVDELKTLVFDVVPKVMTDEKQLKRLRDQKIEGKFFQGRIWVDEEDMQVVKVAGKVVPEFKQRFPKFETYRENIDGRYWFPTYTYSDDTLDFPEGGSLHVRMVIRYKNYRQFQSDVKITSGDEIKDEKPAEETKPATPTTPKKPVKP